MRKLRITPEAAAAQTTKVVANMEAEWVAMVEASIAEGTARGVWSVSFPLHNTLSKEEQFAVIRDAGFIIETVNGNMITISWK